MNRLSAFIAVGLWSALTSAALGGETRVIRVLVWDEQQPEQRQAYGTGHLGEAIADYLRARPGLEVRSVSLESPGQGVDEATLANTDVVIWWSHRRMNLLTDANAERVVARVRAGRLGFIALHSSHWAKPFVRLMQERAKADALAQVPLPERASARWEYLNATPIGKPVRRDAPLTPSVRHEEGVWRLTLPHCVFPAWRADAAPSHVSTLLPQHPLAAGLPARWDIPRTEMYDEPFHVPTPDEVVFEERWDRGEHFRSGCVWQVDRGRVFYFRPGHEIYPVYQQAEPLRVIENAVRWLGTGVHGENDRGSS